MTTESEKSKIAKKISIGSIAHMLSLSINKFLTLCSYLIIFWFVAKEEVGLFFIGLSFMGMISVFLSFGLPAIVQRFTAYYYGRKEYGKIKDLLIKGGLLTTFFSGIAKDDFCFFK